MLRHSRTFQAHYFVHKFKCKKSLSPDDAFDIANQIYDIDRIVPSEYISIARKYFIEDFVTLHPNFKIDIQRINRIHLICYYDNGNHFNAEKVNFYYGITSLQPLGMGNNSIAPCYSCYWNVESKFLRYNRIKELFGGKETIAAILLLPQDINVKTIPKIQTLIINIETQMHSEDYLVTSIDWLLTQWEYIRKDEKSIPKDYTDSIIGGLRRLGYGIAPNYEIDKKRFNFGDMCVIYRNMGQRSVKLTAEYCTSELFIKLASYIVHADKITHSDIEFVERQLQSYHNTSGNYRHLTAVARWKFLSKKQPIDRRTQNAIATLTSMQRKTMGNALVRLACINGNVLQKRIDCLKKVLPLLGIESENIHSQIHRLLTDREGFAVVEKKSDAVEFIINNPTAHSERIDTSSVIINPEKLRIFEQQTKTAHELLSDIFKDENSTTTENTVSARSTNEWIEILKSLLAKDTWNRSEVESLCKARGLMLGATLEQINDFAYEKVDDTVIEDAGEKIYVTLDYKNELI